MMSPTSCSNRNDFVDPRMETRKRSKSFLGDPGYSRVRKLATDVRHGGHLMYHVTEGGRLDEKDIWHFKCWNGYVQ